jgi:hypothetical protein
MAMRETKKGLEEAMTWFLWGVVTGMGLTAVLSGVVVLVLTVISCEPEPGAGEEWFADMEDETVYRISVSYACGGIIANDQGTVVEAAPVFKWMLGKKMSAVRMWLRGKSGSIKPVPNLPQNEGTNGK